MKTLCWIRRDLRLHDHVALKEALASGETSIVFIFDTHILDQLKDKEDRRVSFIYQSLLEIESKLQARGSSLHILHGKPEEEIPKLAQALKVQAVFCNRDYEPYAKSRDEAVGEKLQTKGIEFRQFKDSVMFEKHEVLKSSGEIYKVFTPYKNKWLEVFEAQGKTPPDFRCNLRQLALWKNPKNILQHDWYQEIGFTLAPPPYHGGTTAALKRLKGFAANLDDYAKTRDFPTEEGTSRLSVYLRHGNLSVRDMVRPALTSSETGAKTWLSEIIWRDFYQMILDAFPRVVQGPYKNEYAKIKFIGMPEHFEAWCEGRSGFPLVDAAMRCLNATGLMHNRLRMVVASFLCKTLLIDWRKGEHYFAEKLLDYDLAANNGGWQWSSGSGLDAQPYFRIFNPYTQSEKFDAEGLFIRTWCPELAHLSAKEIHRPDPLHNPDYPSPIVSYETNRMRCLSMYSVVKH